VTPVKAHKLKKDHYYLMYRNDLLYSKKFEIIIVNSLVYDKTVLRFKTVPRSGLASQYTWKNVQVNECARISDAEGLHSMKVDATIALEFFELEASELVELIC
jgi:hypothetical protein